MSLLNETLPERIERERKSAIEDRRLWEPIWQEIAELIYPARSDITVMNAPGRQQTRRLFDSTALVASERLAAAMAGTVTPDTLQWFDPELQRFADLQVPKTVEDWAVATGRAMFNSLQSSNFAVEMLDLYHDLNSFCTAAIFIDDNGDGIPRFRSLHPSEYAIVTNHHKEVIKLIREVRMTIREAIKEFGLENLSQEMQDIVKRNEDIDRPQTFTHWIARREDEQLGFPVDNFPIASIWVDQKAKLVVKKSGFNEWPCPVVRWSTASNEAYGRGPGFTALPDVASLNRAEELALRAWAMSVMPPLLALHDGVLTKPDLRPLRMTFLNQEGGLQWFPPGTKLDIETVKREDKRRSIWNIFFMDQVQFVPERGKTPPSAEEVRARLNIMLQILGPTLSRVEHELLIPLLDRVFGILSRANKLPPVTPGVLSYAQRVGGEINIQFVGPIARAKRQAESATIDELAAFIGGAGQIWPDVADNVDGDEILREKWRIKMGPRQTLRTRDQVSRIRQQRAQAEAQRAQAEMMAQAAQAAGQAAPAIKEAREAEAERGEL